MNTIADQVLALAKDADAVSRRAILDGLRGIQVQVETPEDTLMRLYNSHLQVAVVRVGVNLGLFKALTVAPNGSLTLEELSENLSANASLLERILRYLASTDMITEVGVNRFTANKNTYALADPRGGAGVHHAFDLCSPAVQAFPDFLIDTKYQEVTDSAHTPFQNAFRTDLKAFEWLPRQPKLFGALQQVMSALQSSDWIQDFGLLDQEVRKQTLHGETPTGPTFVDVGGGYGHQCIQLRDRYPSLSGRIILQDLPQTVDKLPAIEGVKVIAHDFFEKQLIEGAKFYYLRRILHDWPDDACRKILQNLSSAMTHDSKILIDEVVLPDSKAHWQAAMQDIVMMVLYAGKERTKRQWELLVEQSGLQIVEIHTYDKGMYKSVVCLELKK